MKTDIEKLEIAIEALKKLKNPVGAFSRDQLEFANNTIDNVKDIAESALNKINE